MSIEAFELILNWFVILFMAVNIIRILSQKYLKNHPKFDLFMFLFYLVQLVIFLIFIGLNYDVFLYVGSSLNGILLFLLSFTIIALCMFYMIRHYRSWQGR